MLEQSPDYLQELDFATAETSVRDYVKKNPGRGLIIAGIAGLAIGALYDDGKEAGLYGQENGYAGS